MLFPRCRVKFKVGLTPSISDGQRDSRIEIGGGGVSCGELWRTVNRFMLSGVLIKPSHQQKDRRRLLRQQVQFD